MIWASARIQMPQLRRQKATKIISVYINSLVPLDIHEVLVGNQCVHFAACKMSCFIVCVCVGNQVKNTYFARWKCRVYRQIIRRHHYSVIDERNDRDSLYHGNNRNTLHVDSRTQKLCLPMSYINDGDIVREMELLFYPFHVCP